MANPTVDLESGAGSVAGPTMPHSSRWTGRNVIYVRKTVVSLWSVLLTSPLTDALTDVGRAGVFHSQAAIKNMERDVVDGLALTQHLDSYRILNKIIGAYSSSVLKKGDTHSTIDEPLRGIGS